MIPRDPEEIRDNEAEPEVEEAVEPENLEAALASEKEKAEEYLANWQRTQADFVNYRRRSEQERQEFNSFAKEIDERVEVRCLMAPPDPHPEDLWCEWEVRLRE